MSFEIDPVKYGQLWEKVDSLTTKVDNMDKEIKELLELANKSRGGFWMGMVIASGVGGLITYITTWWHK